MKIRSLLRQASEYFPSSPQKEETSTDNQPREANNEALLLEHLKDSINNEAYLLLNEALDKLEYPEQPLSPEQRAAVQEIIISDAHDLATRVLPASIVDLLELSPKHPDNIGFEHIQTPEGSETPSLRSLHLLIRAYDDTHNKPLKGAIEYILQQAPPHFSDQLKEAYERAKADNTSIMDEYQDRAVAADTRINRPNRSEDMEIIMAMRKATPPQYRPPSNDGDPEQTGVGY